MTQEFLTLILTYNSVSAQATVLTPLQDICTPTTLSPLVQHSVCLACPTARKAYSGLCVLGVRIVQVEMTQQLPVISAMSGDG